MQSLLSRKVCGLAAQLGTGLASHTTSFQTDSRTRSSSCFSAVTMVSSPGMIVSTALTCFHTGACTGARQCNVMCLHCLLFLKFSVYKLADHRIRTGSVNSGQCSFTSSAAAAAALHRKSASQQSKRSGPSARADAIAPASAPESELASAADLWTEVVHKDTGQIYYWNEQTSKKPVPQIGGPVVRSQPPWIS